MRTRTTAMPLWAKALVALVVIGGPGWGLAVRHDRVTNESRLAVVASSIAGRDVEVHCPGVLRRLGPDTNAGSVRFDADGTPADETRLTKDTCAELDALAEGRRGDQLACAERSSSCGDDAMSVAWAVNTLAHESIHLRGVANEALTECSGMQMMAGAAEQLGATAAQARGLARLHFELGYPQKPDEYRTPDCRDGGPLDMRPDDPVWP